MTVKKTQQTLSTTLEKTEQSLNGLEAALENNVGGSLLATGEQSEASEKNGGLPEGWTHTSLGRFTEYGKTKKVERRDVPDDLWLLELEDVEKGSSKIVQRLAVSERAFKSTKNKFEKGSVLYGKLRPYLNKIVIAPEDGVCSTEIIPINVEPFGSNKYLFYWLKSGEFLGYVNKVSYGVNMPRLGTKDGLAAPLVLPPLAEQTIIAQTLDTLLAQVDNIKTRLDAIPNILKTFRQSVLAAAVSGKLTEAWRGENECGEPKNIAVGKLFNSLDQGWSPKCENTPVASGQWGVIKTSSVQSGYFVESENKKLPQELEPRALLALRNNDILITRAGPRTRCGVTCIVKEDHPNLMICDKVYRIRANAELVLPTFLNWCFNSPQYLKDIERLKTGSSESGMNMTQKKLKELNILLPDLEEQTQIVRRVEELFTFAEQIEQQVQTAQGRVNNLTQSILAKAFRGELTTQWRADNPDLISGENSAEVLLAKIQEEREKLKPKKKTTRKTAASKKAAN